MQSSVIYYLEYQLAEESILPGEPFPCERLRIVSVESLVDESGAGISSHQAADAVTDFILVIGCEGPHHNAHRPDCLLPDMRSSYALSGRAPEKIGIGITPYEFAGVAVNRVLCRNIIHRACGSSRRVRNVRGRYGSLILTA